MLSHMNRYSMAENLNKGSSLECGSGSIHSRYVVRNNVLTVLMINGMKRRFLYVLMWSLSTDVIMSRSLVWHRRLLTTASQNVINY